MPRSTHPIFMVGRMRGGAAAAQEELAAIAADLERAYPENRARGVFVEPLSTVVFGPVRPALLVLLGAVGLVLLVACANVANLLLARGTARRREVAVRTALGASGARLTRQFAVEGLVLATLAAVLGTALAMVGVRALVALAPADIPRIADASVDLRVLMIALAVAIGAGLLFGMVPALQARRVDLQGALKSEGGHGASAGGDRSRLRAILVVAECALAVMLVIGASLLIKSFWRLQHVDAGFRSEGVLKAEYQLPASRYPVDFRRYPDLKEINGFTRGVLQKAERLPGVDAAAVAGNHPLDPGFTNSFRIVGREAEAASQPEISVRRVTAGYFRAMSVPLDPRPPACRFGHDQGTAGGVDQRSRGPALLRRPGSPRQANQLLGRQSHDCRSGWQRALPGPRRGALRLRCIRRSNRRRPPTAEECCSFGPPAIRQPSYPPCAPPSVNRIRRSQFLASSRLPRRCRTRWRSGDSRCSFSGCLRPWPCVLAAIGVHGVLSYMVTQRAREIGIRLALGAQPSGVRRLVVMEGMTLALTGTLLGLGSAYILSKSMGALLFSVTPTDPLTFVIVPVGLTLVAFVASYLPARRATRVDPVTALRAE